MSQPLASPADPGQPEQGADVAAILRVLRTATGADFTQYKPASIRRRIARRMLLQKIDDLGTYARHLRQTPHEAQALYDDLLIQVTGFFRDPEGFEALKRSVFPSLVKERAADEPIRIWVPGCATGAAVLRQDGRPLSGQQDDARNVCLRAAGPDQGPAVLEA